MAELAHAVDCDLATLDHAAATERAYANDWADVSDFCPGGRAERLVLFLGNDDGGAKAVVAKLIKQIGFAPVDVGSLEEGRYTQPDSPLYNEPLTENEARALMKTAIPTQSALG